MADKKPTPAPILPPVEDIALDAVLTPEVVPDPVPAFKADDFLAGKKPKDTPINKPTGNLPPVVKRGGIGFFTAFLMSSVAAGAGAYLALLAGSRPDLLQKAGIAAFLPSAAPTPSVGVAGGNIEPLVARVSAVEAELLALKNRLDGASAPAITGPATVLNGSPAPQPGAATPTTSALPPTAGIGADAAAVKGEIAGMSGRITAMETRLAALDPTGAGGAIIAGLQADIAALKVIVATLQQQAAAAPSPAVTFAVVNLAEAASRQGPFMVELDTLRAAMPNAPEVLALEPFARTGVPTRELLQERFVGLAAALASNGAAVQKDTSMLAWFKGLFSDMVKVQSAPDANGTGNVAILGRAKVKLDQGDFSGGLEEVATIPTPPPLVTEWLAAGRKRLELESRISAVRGAVGRTAPIAATPPLAPAGSAPLPPPAPLATTQGQRP